MAVHKPSENVLYQGRIQNLFQGRAPNFVTFSSIVFFFFGRVNFNLFQGRAPNFVTFSSVVFFSACLRRLRLIVMKRFEIMEKFFLSKALLAGWGGCILCNLYRNLYSNL